MTLQLQAAIAALSEAESFISGFEDDELQEGVGEMLEQIRDAIAGLEALIPPAPASSPAIAKLEQAARAAGWQHGGDGGGFWFHEETWGSWKAAASWEGTDGNDSPLHTTYETPRALFEDQLPEGWRIATDEELAQGFSLFQSDEGEQSDTMPAGDAS